MPETIRLKEETSEIYQKLSALTGMSYTEIARRAARHYIGIGQGLTRSEKDTVNGGLAGETTVMKCLNCGKDVVVEICSYEHTGVFNVFCKGGECEDIFSAKH